MHIPSVQLGADCASASKVPDALAALDPVSRVNARERPLPGLPETIR